MLDSSIGSALGKENVITSTYSSISKEIGWERQQPVMIPDPIYGRTLVSKAREGDIDSFRQLFEIIRFAESPNPNNEDDVEALNICVNGFRETSLLFRAME